ncbi:hypothetical protein TNCV_4368571 [Trichonephila clavipes]|nr:hypothetical protein TNCV_4368571 [Trichonephila clavipes]
MPNSPSQMISDTIGDKYGDQAGQGSVVTVWRHSCDTLAAMTLHKLWERFVAVGRIEAFTTWSPHTNTIVITAEIEPEFVAKDDLIPFRYRTDQFPRVRHHSKWGRRWKGVKSSTRNRCRDPKCSSARHFRMVREDTGALS